MTAILAASSNPRLEWYLTRSTGTVCLVLLTVSVVLGVLDAERLSSWSIPRFAVDAVHRSVSLLAVVFLIVHILTSILDTFVSISIVDAFVPFVGSYRPFWLGLGAVASDLMLAVAITSLVRQRLGYRVWRAVHWAAYACWPIALLHTLGTGTDVRFGWMLLLNAVCLLAVVAAVAARVLSGWPDAVGRRAAALGGAAVFTIGVVLWVPSGPLGKDWARRSGTPASALGTPAPSSRVPDVASLP